MLVLWRMVLLDLMPSAPVETKRADSTSLPGLLCVHWLLNRDFFSESEPCSTCSKSWSDLVYACVDKNISIFHGAYACNFLEGSHNFLMHGAMLVCRYCARSEVHHLVAFLTDVVTSIVTDESV